MKNGYFILIFPYKYCHALEIYPQKRPIMIYIHNAISIAKIVKDMGI